MDQLPTVTFALPASGATVSGTVTLRAAASDDHGVTKVDFFAGGALVGTDTIAPFEASWSTQALLNGAHQLTARATDTAAQVAEASIQVFVANAATADAGSDQLPSVRLIYPVASSKVCGSVTIEAAAADDVGVSELAFFLDGQLLGLDTSSPFQHAWTTTGTTNGLHFLRAVAKDSAGQQAQHEIQLRVENGSVGTCDNLPSVKLTAPSNLFLSGAPVTLSASASDDVGVVKVQFFVDNGLVAEDSTAPYSASWDPSGFAEGAHTLKALAYDTASQTAPDLLQVTLDLTDPTVSITAPAASAVLGSAFDVTVAASDSSGIAKVEVYVDSSLVGQDTTAPYSVPASGLQSGPRTLMARGYDRSGRMAQSSNVSVTVDDVPTVALTAPASGASVKGSVTVSATATDDVGVSQVEFFQDTTSLGVDTTSPYGVTWNTNAVANGSYLLRAVATDTRSQTASAQHQVQVADQPPQVALTSPSSAATVTGSITLSATITDDLGVSTVVFKANGATVASPKNSPWEASWDSCSVPDGTVAIEVVATDSKGQTSSATVNVTVANGPAAPQLSGAIGNAEATLSWDRTCGPTPSSYDLFWATTSGVTTTSTAISAAISPYKHTGLTNGTTYYYRVAPRYGTTLGPLSNEVSVTPARLWTPRAFPTGMVQLNGIWGAAQNDVWVVGQGSSGRDAAASHWTGSSWTTTVLSTTKGIPNAVWGAAANDIWAVGNWGDIYRYNGSTWNSVTSPTTASLNAVWGAGANDVWIAGQGGALYRWQSGGWTDHSTTVANSLRGLRGLSASDVWAVGATGTTSDEPYILHWNGSSWTPSTPCASAASLFAVFPFASNDVWAFGAAYNQLPMQRYSGATPSWACDTSFTSTALNGAWGAAADDLWAGGASTLIHWNGSTWTAGPVSGSFDYMVRDLWGTAGGTLWAVGDMVLIY